MILTEQDALTKQCCRPFNSRCVASSCMAWRWKTNFSIPSQYLCDDSMATTEPARPSTVPPNWEFHPFGGGDDPARWIEPQEETDKRRTGYCGLAGAV
jgi:hypothetical protein